MMVRLGRYAVLACVIFMPSMLGWATAAAHDAAAKNTVVSALPGSQGGEKQGEPERHRRTGKASDRFPNIALRTQDNRPVRFYDDLVKDRVVIINFMYTTCSDICPGTTQNLVDVYELLAGHVGRDMLMLSISIDPEVDTPDALTRYAEIFEGPKPGWLFLTGDYADIDRLRRSLGVYDLDPIVDADKTQHAGIVTFGNDRTNRWAALPAMMDWRELAKTILRITREPKRKHRGD